MREREVARAAAREAGQVLLRHFNRPPAARRKADGSPVTVADTEANRAVVAALAGAFPDDAILSEETEDDGARLVRPRVWIVDPLDGTRDFLEGSGEFAVHVALVVEGRPVVAVVHQPTAEAFFEAQAGAGAVAWRADGRPEALRVSGESELPRVRLGISVHAPGERLLALLARTGLAAGARPIGASIKWMAVASADRDGVLCLHDREKEWDTCAPALVVSEAGGRVTDVDGRPLVWNRADVRHRRGFVVSNGACHDRLAALAQTYWPA